MISGTKTRYEAPVREVFGCLDSAKAATGLWVSWAHRNISLPGVLCGKVLMKPWRGLTIADLRKLSWQQRKCLLFWSESPLKPFNKIWILTYMLSIAVWFFWAQKFYGIFNCENYLNEIIFLYKRNSPLRSTNPGYIKTQCCVYPQLLEQVGAVQDPWPMNEPGMPDLCWTQWKTFLALNNGAYFNQLCRYKCPYFVLFRVLIVNP